MLACAVLVPLGAFLLGASRAAQYESTTEVYVDKRNLAAAITGIEISSGIGNEERIATTEANLALTPEVARRALARVNGAELGPAELLDRVSVEPKGPSDVLTVTVVHRDARLAELLADAYATAFAGYRGELDTQAIANARDKAAVQLADIVASGRERSELARTLEAQIQELDTLRALSTSRISKIRGASAAVQVSPRPLRDAALGLLVGLVLGVGLAFLVEALDTRLRSASEISEQLGMPLLARLPTPPRKLSKSDDLVMLAQPSNTDAEAFRMFRTNLEFALLDLDARTLLFTSAVETEGKSTSAANLAVALAKGGRRVALVDLDLRRPYLERFFELPTTPGVTDVALGRTPLDEALRRIDLATGRGLAGRPNGGANGRVDVGSLDVLVSGPIPPDPGEFVGTARLREIVRSLRERYDLVLLDSPPLLRVGDAMTLTRRVDAVVVVTRLNLVRRPMLAELQRLLVASPARVLGFVVTGADAGSKDDAYGYGYRYHGALEPEPEPELEDAAPSVETRT